MKVAALAAASIAISNLITIYSAAADWQYTKWGMTPEQVMQASKGAAVVNTDRSLDATDGSVKTKLVAPYQAGGLVFRAEFMFDAHNKLIQINLALQGGGSCPSVLGLLTSTYGPQQSKDQWWDHKNGNRVSLDQIGASYCKVTYTALSMPGKPGGL